MKDKDFAKMFVAWHNSCEDAELHIQTNDAQEKCCIPVGGTFYIIEAIEKVIDPIRVIVSHIEIMLDFNPNNGSVKPMPIIHFVNAETLEPCGDSDQCWGYSRNREELIREAEPIRKQMEVDGEFDDDE